MAYEFKITQNEKDYLRDLARKQLEYANLPIMEARKKLWYDHNALKAERPVIVIEKETFFDDLLPELKCETSAAKDMEWNLLSAILNHELIDDDQVISPYYTVYWDIHLQKFGIETKRDFGVDIRGKTLGYKDHYPIKDLKDDFRYLKPSTYEVDQSKTLAWKEFVQEIIGDILPVKVKNRSLHWHVAPSQRIVELMGLEAMMYAMVDYPEEIHALYEFVKKDILAFVKWQEEEGLLTLNNENDYTGAGSYGFTTELPGDGFNKAEKITSRNLWGNMNSQETVGISPAMYGEFIFPYYFDLAKEFGLTYYGCCEPVHNIWEDYIAKLPGLRKVSISPWSDEEYMGQALKGSGIIYSRKPSPNFIGVGVDFDESAFERHITRTLKAAAGCQAEFIFRDVYTLSGDMSKPRKAVQICRNLIEKLW